MKKKYVMPVLLSALLLVQPMHAAAMEDVILPACEYNLIYDVGALEVHFGRDMNGANITVYSIEQEGVFCYYSYDVRLADESMMHCDLKEGYYEMEVTMPSPDGTDFISFPPFAFTTIVISLPSLENIFPFLASAAPFARLIVAQ